MGGGRKLPVHPIRRTKSLPVPPSYQWQARVAIFTVADAVKLLNIARPRRRIVTDPSTLADRLNGVIGNAIGWARSSEAEPKPTDLSANLAAFSADCRGLLSRMGLDCHGQPPDALPVMTTVMQPWFRWLESGMWGLINDAATPDGEARSSAAADALNMATTRHAAAIVSPDCAVAAVARAEAMHVEMGQPLTDRQRNVVWSSKIIKEALSRAAPMLALMAILAEAAAARPSANRPKDNFRRAFHNNLFAGLAGVWFETFGTRPSGRTLDQGPGGPAFNWFKAVLAHAHAGSARLAADTRAALDEADDFADATLANRIRDGANRSRVIANRKSQSASGDLKPHV